MQKKEKITFEEAMQRLEEIINKLELGEVPLEETVKLFEEGMELIKFCNNKLEEVKHKVEMVVRNKEGFNLIPFNTSLETKNTEEEIEDEEEKEDEELPF